MLLRPGVSGLPANLRSDSASLLVMCRPSESGRAVDSLARQASVAVAPGVLLGEPALWLPPTAVWAGFLAWILGPGMTAARPPGLVAASRWPRGFPCSLGWVSAVQ